MRKSAVAVVAAVAVLALEGCVTTPAGPTIPVMPGKNKSFAAFQDDQYYCEGYARDRVAGRVDAANDRIARNSVIGALLGTALGAAVGDTRGAVIGGTAGAAVGASTAHPGYGQYGAQREYDLAYAQCMHYRGNEIGMPYSPRRPHWDRPDRGDYPPPPPPDDYPPPPPPDDN